MSQPLRLLIEVIDNVAGRFDPDLSRSGLFAREAAAGVEDNDRVAASSCGSEDEDDQDLFEEEKAIEQVASDWQPKTSGDDDSGVYVRHVSSRCIHKLMDEGGTHLSCGRAMSARYEVQGSRPNFFHPLCGTCFKDS